MRETESTQRLVEAVKQVDRIDLGKLFASGLDVTISDYTTEERYHVERVTIHAADAGPLLVAFRECLLKALEKREQSLNMQLRMIKEVSP